MKKRMYSLKRQLSVTLLAVLLLAGAIAVIFLGLQIQKYQKDQENVRTEQLEGYAEQLEHKISQLNDAAESLYSQNASFAELNTYRQIETQYNYIYELLNNLKIQVRANQNIEGLFVFYNGGTDQIHAVQERMSYSDQEILKEMGSVAVQGMQSNTYRKDYEKAVLGTEQAAYYSIFLKKTLATIMGTIRLDDIFSGMPEEDAVYGILYNNNFYRTFGQEYETEALEFSELSEGKNTQGNRIIYLKKISSTNLYVVEILPKTIWLYINRTHIILFVLILMLILILTHFYRIMTRQLVRPLEDMTRALQAIQAGVWSVDFQEENRLTEIEDVRETVRILLSEIEQYKIQSYEEKLNHEKTKLQFLSLQLAPHFYTNCLKNAYYMLALQEYENVEKFLLCLSSHLRYLLHQDGNPVTLQEEEGFLLNYIELQKLMQDHPLHCEIEIAEELRSVQIPVLSLQTFVENSIKYTRGSHGQTLRIMLRVSIRETSDGKFLDIFVKDNGDGYPEEVLQMLNQREPAASQKMGVGIVNLISRVRIQYQDRAKWYFENMGGAVSELLLPLKEEERA